MTRCSRDEYRKSRLLILIGQVPKLNHYGEYQQLNDHPINFANRQCNSDQAHFEPLRVMNHLKKRGTSCIDGNSEGWQWVGLAENLYYIRIWDSLSLCHSFNFQRKHSSIIANRQHAQYVKPASTIDHFFKKHSIVHLQMSLSATSVGTSLAGQANFTRTCPPRHS